MRFSLHDIISFFVDFEHALTQDAPPGVMIEIPRRVSKLLLLFEGYANCKFHVNEVDFSEWDADAPPPNHRPDQIGSCIFNFGNHAEIYINTMNINGTKLIDDYQCRFLTLKEAFHVILRTEFLKQNIVHPDTGDPECLLTLIETMVYLPFSIIDLDDDKYPDSERIEHAAELLAIIMLYPFDRVAKERSDFIKLAGNIQDATAIVTDTLSYAITVGIPQRCVDLLFRWTKFGDIYGTYCKLRKNYLN